MFQSGGPMKKLGLILPLFALWSCAAISQPTPTPASSIDGKATAEKIIRPNNGVAAIVLDEKGQPTVVNREGQVVPSCQICTPELERKYGPQCAKARQINDAKASASADQSPLICSKLMGTNVQAVKPVSVIRHTGSDCLTVFFDNGGISQAFEFCW